MEEINKKSRAREILRYTKEVLKWIQKTMR